MLNIFRLTWARFTVIAAAYGDMQGRAIATLFYFTVLAPFGIASSLLSDPLQRKNNRATPSWIDRVPVDHTVEGAGRQG